jgi:two-component system sensor histidine kinase SenX3
VDITAALAGALGLVTGAVAVAAFWWSDRVQRRDAEAHELVSPSVPLVEPWARVLSVLPGAAFVVGADASVLRTSSHAVTLGLVAGDRVVAPQVSALIGQVRRDGVIRELDLELRRPPPGRRVLHARVRVAPLSSQTALVLVEDLSEALRVDEVRRDFVANVSHELKTPVGALSLLAEAVQAASDDPASVQHFATRMQAETARLTSLVNDLIDLSRLQSAPSTTPAPLHVSRVVADALDATRQLAQARLIDVVVGGALDAEVTGDETQLVMALRNLLTNAIAYSPPSTKVVVSTRVVHDGDDDGGDVVEISVTDQGIGIPTAEQGRIFERFYRVDPARTRLTGGTGLGLAIVKHVCANHGGECTVWSVEGEGSTFTLRLPGRGSRAPADPVAAAAGAAEVVAVPTYPAPPVPAHRTPQKQGVL